MNLDHVYFVGHRKDEETLYVPLNPPFSEAVLNKIAMLDACSDNNLYGVGCRLPNSLTADKYNYYLEGQL